tara:strand:- start:167 stop:337 length:171 start_codon:yes stop_codon:yes gene_type:complete
MIVTNTGEYYELFGVVQQIPNAVFDMRHRQILLAKFLVRYGFGAVEPPDFAYRVSR